MTEWLPASALGPRPRGMRDQAAPLTPAAARRCRGLLDCPFLSPTFASGTLQVLFYCVYFKPMYGYSCR